MDQEDSMTFTATFRDNGNASLGVLSIGPVQAVDREGLSDLLLKTITARVPVGARSVDLLLTAAHSSGKDNDAYADNLSLKFTTNARPRRSWILPVSGVICVVVVCGIILVIARRRKEAPATNARPHSNCPRCGWIMRPDQYVCGNPECKTRLK